MTRYLVDAVMLMGIVWFSSQAFRAHDLRPAPNAIEQIQQAELTR